MNYPMNVPKIEASEVLVYGDYVCYLMLGVIDDSIEDEGEARTIGLQSCLHLCRLTFFRLYKDQGIYLRADHRGLAQRLFIHVPAGTYGLR